jgi:hypothetical protein
MVDEVRNARANGERLPVGVADDEAGGCLPGGLGRREAAARAGHGTAPVGNRHVSRRARGAVKCKRTMFEMFHLICNGNVTRMHDLSPISNTLTAGIVARAKWNEGPV